MSVWVMGPAQQMCELSRRRRDQGRGKHVSWGCRDDLGTFSLATVFWLYSNRTAKLVVKEKGAWSAGEAIPGIGSQINRALIRSAGLAGVKVK